MPEVEKKARAAPKPAPMLVGQCSLNTFLAPPPPPKLEDTAAKDAVSKDSTAAAEADAAVVKLEAVTAKIEAKLLEINSKQTPVDVTTMTPKPMAKKSEAPPAKAVVTEQKPEVAKSGAAPDTLCKPKVAKPTPDASVVVPESSAVPKYCETLVKGVSVPDPTDQDLINCGYCGFPVDINEHRQRINKKIDPDTQKIKCAHCNATHCGLRRQFGHWPIQRFKRLTDEQKEEFHVACRDIVSQKGRYVKGDLLVEATVHSLEKQQIEFEKKSRARRGASAQCLGDKRLGRSTDRS